MTGNREQHEPGAERAFHNGVGLGVVILFASLLAIVVLLTVIGQAERSWLTIPFMAAGTASAWQLRRGRTDLAVRAGLAGIWLSALLSLAMINGVRGPTVSVFAALTFFAGWHLGPRAAVALTGLSIAAVGALAYAAAAGWPYPVVVHATPYYNALVHTAVLLAAGTVSYFAARASERQLSALETSRSQLSDKVEQLAVREVELQQAQARLVELNTHLEQRVRHRTTQLQEAIRDLESFSYTVSHDLRAPLRAIEGYLDALRDAEPRMSTEGDASARAIDRNVAQMNELIEGLLRLARVSRTTLEKASVDMNELLRTLLEDFQPDYPASTIRVDQMPTAHGDPTLVRQVLANLVGNALKYSARRPKPEVHVGWSIPERAWFVRDNGVGFDMSQAGRLFENFARLPSSSGYEGTGIGLALVKSIVERHGGAVWALAEPERGAAFYFHFGHDEAGREA